MLPREKYWDQYWSKSSLTAWATEWSAKSMDGPTLGCVEGMGKHYWAAIQRELSRPEERVNKEPYAEPHQSKFKVLQLGSKNPILKVRSQQDTKHLFRIRSEES